MTSNQQYKATRKNTWGLPKKNTSELKKQNK